MVSYSKERTKERKAAQHVQTFLSHAFGTSEKKKDSEENAITSAKDRLGAGWSDFETGFLPSGAVDLPR